MTGATGTGAAGAVGPAGVTGAAEVAGAAGVTGTAKMMVTRMSPSALMTTKAMAAGHARAAEAAKKNIVSGPAGAGKTVKISIDPVTRIEGHLKAEVTVKGGMVVDAKVSGGMYRGFEQILKGRDPRDATQITQRICGVCPTAHATASALALDDAFGVELTDNGRIATYVFCFCTSTE